MKDEELSWLVTGQRAVQGIRRCLNIVEVNTLDVSETFAHGVGV